MYQSPEQISTFHKINKLTLDHADSMDRAENVHYMAEMNRQLFQNYVLPLDLYAEQRKRVGPIEDEFAEKERIKGIFEMIEKELANKYTYDELLYFWYLYNKDNK